MASSNVARLASATAVAVFLAALAVAVPVVAQTDQNVTICEATGSPATPYVFTTIDARDLAEHLARGDFRASSIADCAAPRAAATSSPAATSTPAPALKPAPTSTSPPVRQQGAATSVPISNVSVSQPLATATTASASAPAAATPAASATAAPARTSAAPAVDVAGVQETADPDVSSLPRSGGEPDRPLIVLVLLGLFGAGFALRRLARVRG